MTRHAYPIKHPTTVLNFLLAASELNRWRSYALHLKQIANADNVLFLENALQQFPNTRHVPQLSAIKQAIRTLLHHYRHEHWLFQQHKRRRQQEFDQAIIKAKDIQALVVILSSYEIRPVVRPTVRNQSHNPLKRLLTFLGIFNGTAPIHYKHFIATPRATHSFFKYQPMPNSATERTATASPSMRPSH